jgi:ATP-dependent helicase/nuclease subunit B
MRLTQQHQVALVRPGGEAMAWLEAAVRHLQGGDPLQPVTVAAASPYLAGVVRHRLATMGCANVSVQVQLRPVAERIARASGSQASDRPLTGPLEAAAVRTALRHAAAGVLVPLAANRGLRDALGVLFRELRHLDDDDLGVGVGDGIDAAAVRTYHTFLALTQRWPDVPSQLRIAARYARDAIERPGWAEDLGGLVLFLPPTIDAAEREFLTALGHHVPLAVALGCVEDTIADQPVRELAERIAHVLGTRIAASPPANGEVAHIHVLSAPDPDEEARTVARRLLADMESGVPLWRMAVLYTTDEPYAPLIRETLDAAGVPWHTALGRPASTGVAARSLLALLGLRERGFAREAVLDWVAARPVVTGSDTDPLPSVPISAWDRLSRRAQVLQGPDQWIARFQRLRQTLELESEQQLDFHADLHAHEMEDDVPRPSHDLDHARDIIEAIRRLDRDTRPPAEPATWDAMVDWASGLRRLYVGVDADWPRLERLASDALDEALDSLRDASALEPTTTMSEFSEALAAALEARRLAEGRPGVGVLVAPLGASTGAVFDCTYVLGMAEGVLPSRPSPDPLTAGGPGADPLGRSARQRASERRAFLAACAGVLDGGAVWLTYARGDGAARATHASRWLLEVVARQAGLERAFESDLERLFDGRRPWLERIASAYEALQRGTTPMHVADLRLSDVLAAHAGGGNVADTPLAARNDLVLGRALRAGRARASGAFTEFDGNVASLAAESSRVAYPFTSDSTGSSATSLERWATCPFRYFLSKVLRVEATERPEEEWTITALDRGSLVHQALERFFRERLEQGRSRPDEPFGPADHARLDEITSALLVDLEAQGRTGHAVAWDNARTALLRDLHFQLDREEEWRLADGLAPARFEQTFGDARDPNTWPAVQVQLADGSVIRFRGAIDRVDLSPERALVIDYKSGGTFGYDGLDADPVLGGRHLQLALYARAVRDNVEQAPGEVRAEYRFVSSKGKFERRQILADEGVEKRLAEVVQHAASGIRAGAFLPRPGDDDWGGFKNCRFCEYDRICSTTRDDAWRRKSPGASFVPLEQLR